MELVALIFAGISAIGTVISIFIALRAKSDVEKLKIQMNDNNERGVNGKNTIKIKSKAKNTGVIGGINTGDVNVREEK